MQARQRRAQLVVPNKLPNKLPNNLPNKLPNKTPNKLPNKNEANILSLLAGNPRLTRSHLAQLTGLSDSTIKHTIAKMKENGWLQRAGSNKTGYWLITPPNDPHLK